MKARVTETEREQNRETNIFNLLVHSLMATTGRAVPGLSLEPGTPSVSPLWLAGAQVVELSSTALPGILVGSWTGSVTIQTQSSAHTGCHYCRLGEIHHNTTDTIWLYFMVEWGRGSRQSLLPFHQCLLCFSLFFIMRDTFLDLCKELMKNRKQAETFPTVVDPSGLIFWLSVLGLS